MYLAIDLGGTKTLVATFSPKGEVIERVRFPTNHDYDQYLKDLANQIATLHIDHLDFCVMAIPGLIDRRRGLEVSLGNLPWKNKPIRNDISQILNGVPMAIENDSKAGGLSEALLLKETYEDVLYLTISTGIGGALVRNGKIVKAMEDMELGKIPVLFEGKFTHWEEFAAGRYVVARFSKHASDITDPEVWRVIGAHIAYGVGVACSVMQPEAIVFDGGVGQFANKFESFVREHLQKYLHTNVRQPQALLTAQRPNEAVIYGCYELARAHHGKTA